MITAFGLLLAAIALEVIATSALPRTEGFRDPVWSALVVAGYAVALCAGATLALPDPVTDSEPLIPIPSEPIPGHRGNAAHAPAPIFQPAVATSQSSGPAIQRAALAPVHPASGDQGAGADGGELRGGSH